MFMLKVGTKSQLLRSKTNPEDRCRGSVGDITTGRKPPYLGWVTLSVVKYVKAQEGRGGLKAHGRFKACSRKSALVVNLYCKLGISRDQTGHIYEPVLGLRKPTGVTHVYKGTTRRRFKDNRQQLET